MLLLSQLSNIHTPTTIVSHPLDSFKNAFQLRVRQNLAASHHGAPSNRSRSRRDDDILTNISLAMVRQVAWGMGDGRRQLQYRSERRVSGCESTAGSWNVCELRVATGPTGEVTSTWTVRTTSGAFGSMSSWTWSVVALGGGNIVRLRSGWRLSVLGGRCETCNANRGRLECKFLSRCC